MRQYNIVNVRDTYLINLRKGYTMLYEVYLAMPNGKIYLAKVFNTEKDAKLWIQIRRSLDKRHNTKYKKSYWIEETL